MGNSFLQSLDQEDDSVAKVVKPTNSFLQSLEEDSDTDGSENPNIDTSNLEKVWEDPSKQMKDPRPSSNFFTPDESLQSKDDLYSRVSNDPKYKPIADFESNPENIPNPRVPFHREIPEDIQRLKSQRDKEYNDIYENTGHKGKLFGFEMPWRVQDKVTINEDFDKTKPISEDNPIDNRQEYLVPGPHDNRILNMAYQVLEQSVGGALDIAMYLPEKMGLPVKGGIIKEGTVSQMMPDSVPNSGLEQFTTDLVSLAVGPSALKGVVKGAAKGVKMAESTLAAEAALQKMSPQAVKYIRDTYQGAIKAGQSAAEANRKAAIAAKYLTVSMGLGIAEAGAAGEGAEPFVGNITGLTQTLETSLGIDKSTAKDFALVLDTPVINGVFQAAAKAMRATKEKIVTPVLGGARNIKFGNVDIGRGVANVTTLGSGVTEYSAGYNFLTWLDPNLGNTKIPEVFAQRVRFLGDAVERNAQKRMVLGDISRDIQADSADALIPVAEDYFRNAYSNLADSMSKEEFDSWVNKNAADMANRLYEERTALSMEPEAASQFAKNSNELKKLLEQGAENEAKGADSLSQVQELAGEYAGQIQQGRLDDLKLQKDANSSAVLNAQEGITSSKMELDKAKDDLANLMGTDKNANSLMKQAEANDVLGSDLKLQKEIAQSIPEPLYQAWKTLKTEKDSAYKAIADSGAKGDNISLMSIITEADPKKSNPFLQKIFKSVKDDSSFGNLYNTVRNQVSREIRSLSKANKEVPDYLYKLKSNIEEDQLAYLVRRGNPEVSRLVENARQKYIDYVTAVGDDESIKRLADTYGKTRLAREELPIGLGNPLGQGVTDWNRKAVETVRSGLEGESGDAFAQSLDRISKAGGQPMDKALASYYTNKSLKKLYEATSGGTPNVKALRSALSDGGVIENLERFNPTLAKKYRKLATTIETQEGIVNTKTNELNSSRSAFNQIKNATDKIKVQLDDIEKELNSSVLNEFLGKGNQTLKGSDSASVMKKIFSEDKSSTKLQELFNEADKLGDNGRVIKEALRGSYIDYLKDRMFTKKALGIPEIKGGRPVRAFAADEDSIEKMFKEGSKDVSNLKVLFSDRPEVITQLEDIGNELIGSTKTLGASKEQVLGRVPQEEDPVKATSNAIAIAFGTLNPTAVTLRRVTLPVASRSLEEVKRLRFDIIKNMMLDPKFLNKMSNIVADKTLSLSDRNDLILNTLSGATKALRNDDVNEGNIKKKVPKGVK